MTSIIVWLTLISLIIQISGLESSGLPATSKLVLYQHRVELLYSRMRAEGCSLPGDAVKRHVLSETVGDRLEVEKALYERLYDVLIQCRKVKLRPTHKPTSATKTPSLTTEATTAASTTTAVTTTASTTTASTTTAVTTTASTTTASTTTAVTTTASITTATTTAAHKCPKDYYLNPVSSTCIRLVKLTWSAAKTSCESSGEYLAVFETQESVRWLDRFLKDSETPATWTQGYMYIGLKYTNGAWRWTGRLTTVLSDDGVWFTGYPTKGSVNTHPYGCVSADWNGLGHCNETADYSICEQRNQ